MKKRILSCLLGGLLLALPLFGCAVGDNGIAGTTGTTGTTAPPASGGDQPVTPTPPPPADPYAEQIASTVFYPTVYDTDEVVTAEQTEAGSFEAWQNQVFLAGGGNNDEATENSIIKSPFHTLKINGREVPVYTARCGKGAHSFAWVDISKDCIDNFALKVELSVSAATAKCVVLPESREVTAAAEEGNYISYITATGSFTYTFAASADAAVTDPTLAPLTLMVTEEVPLEIPEGYATVTVEPGVHGSRELEFKTGKTVYIIKAGFHDISSIGMPSDSILYIERGAYIEVNDRYENGAQNGMTAIHADDVQNVKIISRGLLDCGKVMGGPNKFKHVFNSARSKNVSVEGLTIINANTWTMCFYASEGARATHNLLLGYRTYSDGIMMSECRSSVGSYNFVRTGDDGIEFKGTGWWGATERVGEGCVYEYNDVWTDKGAGYCLTWEATCSMQNMIFRHNSVGFAQPTWAERAAALDIYVGSNANARWGDVLFEDIEIYCVLAPNAINIEQTSAGVQLENITFKNIRVAHTAEGVFAFRLVNTSSGGSVKNITLEDYSFCGKTLTAADKENAVLFCNKAEDEFGEVSVISE